MAAPVTAAEARAAWLAHLANERRASPRTLEAYGFAAGRYIAFLARVVERTAERWPRP